MPYSMKRCVHIDFHTMPAVKDFARNIDAAVVADMLCNAHVTWVNLFARCNIGFSYYPTKLGTVYPGLERDLLGELIEQCHKREIGVTAYLNIDLNHELLRQHPELCRVNRDGSIIEQSIVHNNFYRSGCLNGEYRSYLMEEIREILAKNPDGIFCDCLIPKPCYCDTCRTKMAERGIDSENVDEVGKFAFDTVLEVARDIRSVVPRDKRLFLNSFPYDRVADLCSQAELECLPSDYKIWGYDFFTTNAPYWRNFSKDRLYMTGRFGRSWGDYGGYRSEAALECDIYDALMYGYAPSVGDHMDPVNGLDANLYSQIGKLYEKVIALEPWMENAEPIVEAAILRNRSAWRVGANASVKGAAKLLSERKICFDIVDETMTFDGYSLLVLPNGLQMTEALRKKLAQYPGKILSCGTSLDLTTRWSFISKVELDENADGFFERNGTKLAMYAPAVKIISDNKIYSYIEPMFPRIWDGKHAYFYIPPGQTTDYCAIAGDDHTVHVGFDVFKAYFENDATHLYDVVDQLLRELLPVPLVDGDLPVSARATLLRGKKDLLQIKTTYPETWGQGGRIREHVYLPAGRQISVAGAYSAVRTVPNGNPLGFAVENGRTWITLPEIPGYLAIELS